MTSPNLITNSDTSTQFDELCISLDELIKRVRQDTNQTVDVEELSLAKATLSQLRLELGQPTECWPGQSDYLVKNDFFALRQLANDNNIEQNCIFPALEQEGRVTFLRLNGPLTNLEGIALLSELNSLKLHQSRECNFAPLTECLKLREIKFGGRLFDRSEGENVESILAELPLLEHVYIHNRLRINLGWTENHTSLLTLHIPSIDIQDLTPLSSCTNLQDLDISFNPILSYKPLLPLTNLISLDITNNPNVDFPTISKIERLTNLVISHDMQNLPGFRDCEEAITRRGGNVRVMQ